MNWTFTAGSNGRSDGAAGAPCIFRRTALMTAFACCLCGVAFPSFATTSEQAAVKVVSQMMQDMGDLYRTATSEDQIADGLEEVFSNYSDMSVISRSVIGPPWRRVPEWQREEFIRVFKRYLSEKYARHFPEALKGQYSISRVLELKKGLHSVESSVSIDGSMPYRLRWHVLRNNGKSLIINMVTDEFDLRGLERTVIRSLLKQRRGQMDRLIAYLPTRYK